MKNKKMLKIAGGLALGVGLGVAGKKIIENKLSFSDKEGALSGDDVIVLDIDTNEFGDVWLDEEDAFALDFINNAPKSELTKVQGIGNALSTKIIEHRPYFELDELKNKVDRVPNVLFELQDVTE